jgi:hypothetical protein
VNDSQGCVIYFWRYIMKASDSLALILILMAISYIVSMFVAV